MPCPVAVPPWLLAHAGSIAAAAVVRSLCPLALMCMSACLYVIVSSACLSLQTEFLRGHQLFEKFNTDRKANPSLSSAGLWEELLQPSPFFLSFGDFLDVKVSSRREEDQLIWLGYVESKVRQLVLPLSKMPHLRVVPYPKPFTEKGATWTSVTTTTNEDGSTSTTSTQETLFVDHFFVGLEFDLAKIKEQQAAATPYQSTTAGLEAGAAAAAPVQMNLSDPVNQFRAIVFDYFSVKDPERSARGFNCDVLSIRARALPDFVFPDERRPEGWGKKKGTGKKRKDVPAAPAAAAAATAPATASESPMPAATPSPVTPATPAVSASSTVKSEESSTSGDAQDAKRLKLETISEVTKGPSPSAAEAMSDELPKLESVVEAAAVNGQAEAAATSGVLIKDEPMPSPPATAPAKGAAHEVHEMQLALAEEPLVVAKTAADAAPSTTTSEDAAAGTATAPAASDASATAAVAAAPTGPPIVVAADNVPVITQSQSVFEVKKRVAPGARAPLFKVAAAPKPAPTAVPAQQTQAAAPAPAAVSAVSMAVDAAPAPNAASSVPVAASSAAPGGASSAATAAAASPSPAAPVASATSPPLTSRPTPPTRSPPPLAALAMATPTKPSAPPSAAPTSSASAAPASATSQPLSLRPHLQRSGSKPAGGGGGGGGGGRILTSDDLDDDMHMHCVRPMQQLQSPQQPQQSAASSAAKSSGSAPLLPTPAGVQLNHSQGDRQHQQQQHQSHQLSHSQQRIADGGDDGFDEQPDRPRRNRGGRGRGRGEGAGAHSGSATAGTGALLTPMQQQQQMLQQQLYQQQMMLQQMMAAGGGGMNPMLLQQQQQQLMIMQQQQQQMIMMQQQQQQQQQQRGGHRY